jgi:hypothetical protein
VKYLTKKLAVLFLVFSLTLVTTQNSYAQDDKSVMTPKLKAFLIVSAYGTALGALLGVASLAFDAKERAIAQGASLGLYAGIIFGIYIVTQHGKKNQPAPGTYQDSVTPYGEESIPPPDDPYAEESDSGGGFFDIPNKHQFQLNDFNEDFEQFRTHSRPNDVPMYMELIRVSF